MNAGKTRLETLNVVFRSHLASPAVLAIGSSSASASTLDLDSPAVLLLPSGFCITPRSPCSLGTLAQDPSSTLFLAAPSWFRGIQIPIWTGAVWENGTCCTICHPTPTLTDDLVWFCRLHTCLVPLLRCGARLWGLCVS